MRSQDLMILGIGLIALSGGILVGVSAYRGDSTNAVIGASVIALTTASLLVLIVSRKSE